MNVSVVVPCYRAKETLPELVALLEAAMSNEVASGSLSEWEILLVVNGNPEDTAKVAAEIGASHPHVTAVLLRRNFGQHNALIAGIRAAQFDGLVPMDHDLQHPPEEIAKLIAALRYPAVDLEYGIPEVEEHGVVRSTASRFIKSSLSLAGVANARWVGAFRVLRTNLREGFADINDPQPKLDVLLSWSTTSVAPVRVRINRRSADRSSYSLARLVRHALNMITGYGVVPKLATRLGFCFGILGIVILVVVLVNYLIGETTVADFTTTIAAIALFSARRW